MSKTTSTVVREFEVTLRVSDPTAENPNRIYEYQCTVLNPDDVDEAINTALRWAYEDGLRTRAVDSVSEIREENDDK